MSRRKRDPIREFIHGPCTPPWPNCACGKKYYHLSEVLPGLTLTGEEFDDMLLTIVVLLSCIAHRCPKPTVRQHALMQLMRPVFAEVTGKGRWPLN